MVEWPLHALHRNDFSSVTCTQSTAKYIVAVCAMTGEGVAGCKTGHMLNSRELGLGRARRAGTRIGLAPILFPIAHDPFPFPSTVVILPLPLPLPL